MDLSFIESIVPKEHFNTDVSGTPLERAQSLIDQCHPGHTHMKLLQLDGQESSAEIPLVQDTRALHGLLHGGVYYTVGDTITALMCTFHIENPEQRMVTASGSIRYRFLRVASSGGPRSLHNDASTNRGLSFFPPQVPARVSGWPA